MKKQTKQTTKEKTYTPRHLARSVAKANMAREGVQHVNRHFALNWKNWVTR